MFRSMIVLSTVMILLSPVAAIEMIWDGGDGDWNDPNWNGGMVPEAIVGRDDGSRGAEDDIFIVGGSNVLFNGDEAGDFHIRQGSTFTIAEGSSWTQLTTSDWSENRWTQLDLSELILDGGSFNRIGSGPGDGGGTLIFGSWRGDDNFDSVPPPQEVNVDIINGGSMMNEGQLWFGAGEDHPAGLIVNININDGTLDLTGGDVLPVDNIVPADLVFFFDIDEDGTHTEQPGDRKDEDYNINFTGPGSITVDNGIIMPFKTDDGDWVNLEQATFEDVWSNGILQANGMGEESGLNFNEFFRTEGDPGSNNYTLISLVGEDVGIDGDINMDGKVDASDLNIIGLNWQMDGKTAAEGDLTGDGVVNAADLNIIGLNWQAGADAAPSAVPEPSSNGLFALALLGWLFVRNRRC